MKSISPFSYDGIIDIPYSKSYLQRAIAIACLTNTEVQIISDVSSDDAKVAIGIAEQLGADIVKTENGFQILMKKDLDFSSVSINCGEAGLSTRMFSVVSACLFDNVVLNGKGSILSRPMDMIIEALEFLGVKVESNNGLLPLKISGRVAAGDLTIDGSESSQLLTGLLIGLPTLIGNSVVHVKDLKSKPYIEMTISILEAFGIEIRHDQGFSRFDIQGNQIPKLSKYAVEGDWSGASFHVVGAAISGSCTLKRLNRDSVQADRAILDAVRLAGANVEVTESFIKIEKNVLHAFEFDATDCPDLFPPLAALAACCIGVTTIKGVTRLKHKESDRGITIQEELGKLGIDIKLIGDIMEVTGGGVVGATISSRGDHRIAMMGAVLASVSNSSIEIENPNAVNKSYADFYTDLELVGASIL